MSIRGCSTLYRSVPGIGPIAKFDPLSDVESCKALYNNGTRNERDQLVQRFCNRFEKGNIPSRCRCYRFKDMPEFEKYSSLWANLLDNSRNGIAGDPVVGSFACFYEGCTTDPDVYKTFQIEEASKHCPSTVFCKQVVGDINVDGEIDTAGKTLGQIAIDIEQECGKASPQPDPNNNSDNSDNVNNSGNGNSFFSKWSNAIYIGVGVLSVLILILVLLSLRRQK